jgi:hypothetical protein
VRDLFYYKISDCFYLAELLLLEMGAQDAAAKAWRRQPGVQTSWVWTAAKCRDPCRYCSEESRALLECP